MKRTYLILPVICTLLLCACHKSRDIPSTEIPPVSMLSDSPEITAETCPHIWMDARCEDPKTCYLCGATDGDPLGHQWAEATCTSSSYCETCSCTEGDPIPHQWSEATCSSPMQCRLCGIEEGLPGDHKWYPLSNGEEVCAYCNRISGKENIEPYYYYPFAAPPPEDHIHEPGFAGCEMPQVCTICGEVGYIPGHYWHGLAMDGTLCCWKCGLHVHALDDPMMDHTHCYYCSAEE